MVREYGALREARAKINLMLNVVGEAPNGYHELKSVMHAVSLHDDIEVTVALDSAANGGEAGSRRGGGRRLPPEAEITLDVESGLGASERARLPLFAEAIAGLPADGRNAAAKAAMLFLGRHGICAEFPSETGAAEIREQRKARRGSGAGSHMAHMGERARAAAQPRMRVSVRIVKRIPISAGLAGGSADAAATLLALDGIFCGMGMPPLPDGQLRDISKKVGADVPFCAMGAPAALAEGIGDRLTPLPPLPPDIHIVLVNPNLPMDTAWVFSRYASPPEAEAARLSGLSDVLGRALGEPAGDFFAASRGGYFNALESVAISEYHVIGEIKTMLLRHGAEAALMTGSGATVFGLFSSGAGAARARRFAAGKGFWACACRPARAGA
jgi:4-diphosphocytidyl-2C-methyl-D-erythritol kinase